jgi:hypothetical protein
MEIIPETLLNSGKEMTLNMLKPVYKVKVIQEEDQTEQNFYFE